MAMYDYGNVEQPQANEKKGFFTRLKEGLTKSRSGFVADVDRVFLGYDKICEDLYDDLEEVLIMGDIGVNTTEELLDEIREAVNERKLKLPGELRAVLVELLEKRMSVSENDYVYEYQPSIIMLVGVNGVGKTTTVGKLAAKSANRGKKTIIAAADTFRAAAGDQLQVWADRAGVPMIGGMEGTDPGAVVFDAVSSFKSKQASLLLVDTAGRLHNKKNLMEELARINRIIDKEAADVYRETWVVLDATTGQNALQQAKDFSEVTNVSGIVLTKMDGTAKGGIAIAIESELHIPVKYIGVGETVDDLDYFNPHDYVKALFE